MEYKQILNELNKIDETTRNKYNQLYGMYVLQQNGGNIRRPVMDGGLETTLSNMNAERNPKVIATTKGAWLWEKDVYALTNFGDRYISTEIANTQRIHNDLAKIKSYKNLDEEVDRILRKQATTITDYYMKKAMFIDKLFDKENLFYKTKNIGEYILDQTSGKLEKKKKEVERFESKNSSTIDSNTDDMTSYMMMGMILSDSSNQSSYSSYSSSSSASSGCGGGFTSSGCGGGSSSSSGCGGGSSGCGGGGCGGGGCGGG